MLDAVLAHGVAALVGREGDFAGRDGIACGVGGAGQDAGGYEGVGDEVLGAGDFAAEEGPDVCEC